MIYIYSTDICILFTPSLQRCAYIDSLFPIAYCLLHLRFQRSLEVNAILHDKWLGPQGAGRKASPSPDAERPGSTGMIGDR